MSADDLVRRDLLAPLVANATGDDRWLDLQATLISGGKSNLTFELTSPAGSLILRRPPSGPILPSAHDMGREARIQDALADSDVPVPRVVLRGGPDLLGAPFYVMNKVEGHIIREELPEGYAETAAEKLRMSYALVDVLAAIHAIDPASVGLEDYGRPHGFVERQLRRFAGQWERSRTKDVAVVDELGVRLTAAIPRAQGNAIVHGDYRLDNCLMDLVDPGRIRAVLDWELSTLGDPLTDLGLLLFYWREPGEREPLLVPSLTRSPGFPGRAQLAERYVAQTGVGLDTLSFFVALAHFKFAVIVQGISARVDAGSMAGQDFGDLDSEVADIAEEGLALLSTRTF